MRVIICEKPSVSAQFYKALKINGSSEDGFYKGVSAIDNEEYTITWAVGHLVKMAYPESYDAKYEKRSLDTLPFIPDTWKYELLSGTVKQFRIIDKIFKGMKPGKDIYFNAGDSGREGEYIQRLIVKMSKMPKGVEMRRIWIDSQTDEEILRGIREAKPVSYYNALSDAAYLRAKEDYLVGINFSRLLTSAFGRDFNKEIKANSFKPINVGRVMTTVLALVVKREREIRSFKESSFYKIEADTGFKSTWKVSETSEYYGSSLLFSDTGFKNRSDAEKFASGLLKTPKLTVKKADSSLVKKQAPTLFNLAELQAECAKRFKISPDRTLEIAQKLYESKLTTYPRTDARVLSSAVAKEIEDNVLGLSANLNMYENEISGIMKNPDYSQCLKSKRYVDDSKITDHYAIIPTGHGSASGLSELEESVFDLVARRFLAIFYPAALYDKYEIILMHDGREQFVMNTEMLTDKGFLSVYDADKKDDDNGFKGNFDALKKLKEGDVLPAAFSVTEGKTSPPKRYTSGSMIIAMENAGRLIEDEELRNTIKGSGIGTSATRAGIITKLVKTGYLCLNKKTQVLTPHSDGEAVFDIVNRHIPDLLEPEMTAKWEQGLSEVAEGKAKDTVYLHEIEDYVRNTVDKIKSIVKENTMIIREEAGVCPACSGKLFTTSYGYVCEHRNGQDGTCNFTFNYKIAGRDFSPEEIDKAIDDLHKNGVTEEFEGFRGKSGNAFSAGFTVEDKSLKFKFFDHKTYSDLICPECGKNLLISPKLYSCECGFKLWKNFLNREFTEDEIKKLLLKETIHVDGLTSKAGKTFGTNLCLDNGKITFVKD